MKIKEAIIKSIIYRSFSFLLLLISIALLTGNIQLSVTVSLIDLVVKTIGYFLFELTWSRFLKPTTDTPD